VTAYGKNLANEAFFTNAYRQDFGDTVIWGAPRTFGMTVQWDYGG